MGYLFIPVLLPVSAMYWLRKARTATATTTDGQAASGR
jgi:hypothetical protein